MVNEMAYNLWKKNINRVHLMIPQYIYHIDPFIILLMMLFILITFLHDNVYVSRDPKKWTYLNEWMSELMTGTVMGAKHRLYQKKFP